MYMYMYITMLSVLFLVVFLQLSAASCPGGWLRHDSSCYLFSQDQEQWTRAAITCSAFGGKLVEIETSAENEYLSKIIDLFGRSFWIGLSDVQEEGIWKWMVGKQSLTDVGFEHWQPGKPDNLAVNEHCARLMPNTTGGWDDFHCTGRQSFICEYAEGV